jgi:hypothetical protein
MWLGRALADAQERALLLAGVRPESDDPSRERIVFDAGTAFNAAGIEGLLALGRARQEPIQVAMPGHFGGLIEEASGGELPFLAAYLPGNGVEATREHVLRAPRVELDLPERSLDVPVPAEAFGADFVSIPLSDAFFFPTHQWTQALWANLLGLSPFLWRELAGYTWPTVVWRICCAVVRVRSIRPERVLTGLRRIGKGSVVHNGAILEGCWIGRDVQIGVGAVIRGCVVGDGAVIEAGAYAEYSVLGPGVRLEGRARVAFSVMERRSHCGGDLLMSFVGPEARVDGGVVLRDIGAEQGSKVQGRSGAFTPPLGRIGVGLGARARLREGCRVSSSIFLPPGCDVAAIPAARLERMPEVGEGEFVIADGGLVPR